MTATVSVQSVCGHMSWTVAYVIGKQNIRCTECGKNTVIRVYKDGGVGCSDK